MPFYRRRYDKEEVNADMDDDDKKDNTAVSLMNGWMVGWTGGWMMQLYIVRMHRQKDRMDGRMDRWAHGWIDDAAIDRKNGEMDGWTDGYTDSYPMLCIYTERGRDL